MDRQPSAKSGPDPAIQHSRECQIEIEKRKLYDYSKLKGKVDSPYPCIPPIDPPRGFVCRVARWSQVAGTATTNMVMSQKV